MGLEVREDGEKPPWLPCATSPPPPPSPRNSVASRPCRGRAWQAGFEQRAHVPVSCPTRSPSWPPRTQMRRGVQGLSPAVHAALQGKQFRPHNSQKKSSKWIQASSALLTFPVARTSPGSYSSMSDHETFAYTSLTSLL